MGALLTIGTKLRNQRYKIDKLIKEGGFGAIYKATDVLKTWAIKENFDTTPDGQTQFMNEAKMLANLDHRNLPKVVDYFIENNKQYLVMEFIEGDDLYDLVNKQGAFKQDQILPDIVQICDALDYLHSQNPPIVHRDIKPHNIIISTNGIPKLVDFGIAKFHHPGSKTFAGARAVTTGFSPPEQYGGGTDPRSDVYALGATLYHILTKVEPVESTDRISGPPLARPREFNSSISSKLENIILKAMELNIENRFQSINEMKAALQNCLPAPGENLLQKSKSIINAGILKIIAVVAVLLLLFIAIKSICNTTSTSKMTDYKLFTQAKKYEQKQDFGDAINNYQQLITIYPGSRYADSSMYQIGAICFHNLNDWNQALTTFRQLINDFPQSELAPIALYNICHIYADKLKDFDHAKQSYNEFLQKYPVHVLGNLVKFELDNFIKQKNIF